MLTRSQVKNMAGQTISKLSSSKIYQFKISLKYIDPSVWRRIQVPENYSFWDLHAAIVSAMGWSIKCFHIFSVCNPKTDVMDRVTTPLRNDHLATYENRKEISGQLAFIKDYFVNVGDKAEYDYNFGHGWKHIIELEEILPAIQGDKYPKCLAGKNACPVDDNNEDPEYDPKQFDPLEVDFHDVINV